MAVGLVACHGSARTVKSGAADSDSIAGPAKAAAPVRVASAPPKQARLSPLADSIAGFIVLAPEGESSFTVASRNKRMLVDIGRVDIEVRKDSARAAAFREAVMKRSRISIGARFRVRGPWGAEDATVTGIDAWNGRVALRLSGSPMFDSLARQKTPVIAVAFRTDSAAPPVADSCDRTSPLAAQLAARVALVRDSIERDLRAGPPPPYERLQKKMAVTSSQVIGCFGPARVALAVSLKAGNVEWVRERIVLVDTTGKAHALRVSDFRFRAHELLQAFDADGDGIDDLATRATTERAGATTLLALDLTHWRLSRLTAGFAWEDQ